MTHPWSGETVVGVFDILGFKELVLETPHQELGRLLLLTNRKTDKTVAAAEFLSSIMISDTIVLYGISGNVHDDAAAITGAASDLIATFARRRIPLRGALTYGYLHVSPTEGLIGPALVRGYLLEQDQEWAGAIVDPACQTLFDQAQAAFPRDVQCLVRYHAPMKRGERVEYLCVNWLLDARPTEDDIYVLFAPRAGGTAWQHDVFRKMRNTREFVQFCRGQNETDALPPI
jgi:hypothetical protein